MSIKGKESYLEDGEKEAKKCKNYDSNCYCIGGETCYVFDKVIRKSRNCPTFENLEENSKKRLK